MLLFRSEEHVDRWCARRGVTKGMVLSLHTARRLADAWYRDRLAPDWRRKTPDEAEALFRELGLGGEFWRLR